MGSSRQPVFHTWLFMILPSLQCLLEIIPKCFQSGSLPALPQLSGFQIYIYIFFLRQTILCKLDIDQGSRGLMSVSEDGEIFPNPFLSLPRQPYVNLTKHPCKQNKRKQNPCQHQQMKRWNISTYTAWSVTHSYSKALHLLSQVKWNNFMPFILWKHHCYWKIRYTN